MKKRKKLEPKESEIYYVVRLNRFGYFGKKPWTASPLSEAIKLSASDARAHQNRLSKRGYVESVVETHIKSNEKEKTSN